MTTKIIAIIVAAILMIAAYNAGVNHVIYNAEIFAVEIPERNAEGEMTVYLEIDNQVHEYGCWIG